MNAARVGLLALSLVAALAVVPRIVCGYRADAFYDGDADLQHGLATSLSRAIARAPDGPLYRSGSSRFDGQSAIATYQMTIMALSQIVLQHPDKRAAYLPTIRLAADRLVEPSLLRYASEVYPTHAVTGMSDGEGHTYVGYINLALGMLRLVDPKTRHCALHDRLSAALATRLFAARDGMIDTYPGERWPPDVAVVAGSIGLHATATGQDVSSSMAAWALRFRSCAVHASGYLAQRVGNDCAMLDAPRGSGTAIAAYAIRFAHPDLARDLHDAIARAGRVSLLGFGGIREYAPGFDGEGDWNAGPILLGASVGATGFALGSARLHGDRELYRELFRSAWLLGGAVGGVEERSFANGGTLGNALLLAMLTARSP